MDRGRWTEAGGQRQVDRQVMRGRWTEADGQKHIDKQVDRQHHYSPIPEGAQECLQDALGVGVRPAIPEHEEPLHLLLQHPQLLRPQHIPGGARQLSLVKFIST
ncbi:hypothetical protein E2C01_029591 [Portunus trituberculatus]|uniref:Uncharacterized protein n=1 Tax=Portunus trituberculatus TaxID=210409 RepID=A0A5B7EV02_PORTR|nr:hypothetical protein [Portunus trituberculatus]